MVKITFSVRSEGKKIGATAIAGRTRMFSNASILLGRYAHKVQDAMADYPPQPQPAPIKRKSSKLYYPKPYQRTGRLGQSWSVRGPRRHGTGIVVEVGNIMRYWHYVQGQRQRTFHKAHGWQRVQVVGKELWDKEYKQKIRNALLGK